MPCNAAIVLASPSQQSLAIYHGEVALLAIYSWENLSSYLASQAEKDAPSILVVSSCRATTVWCRRIAIANYHYRPLRLAQVVVAPGSTSYY
jgi:hypothetical protein